MSRPFQVEFEYAGRELRVKGIELPEVATNLKGHPDTWSPGEAQVFEDVRIYEMEPQGRYLPLSIKEEKELLDDGEFMEELRKQV